MLATLPVPVIESVPNAHVLFCVPRDILSFVYYVVPNKTLAARYWPISNQTDTHRSHICTTSTTCKTIPLRFIETFVIVPKFPGSWGFTQAFHWVSRYFPFTKLGTILFLLTLSDTAPSGKVWFQFRLWLSAFLWKHTSVSGIPKCISSSTVVDWSFSLINFDSRIVNGTLWKLFLQSHVAKNVDSLTNDPCQVSFSRISLSLSGLALLEHLWSVLFAGEPSFSCPRTFTQSYFSSNFLCARKQVTRFWPSHWNSSWLHLLDFVSWVLKIHY